MKAQQRKGGTMLIQGNQFLQWPSWDVAAQIKEGFEANSVVYACVNLISKTAANIPWVLSRKRGANSIEVEDPNHPLMPLLARPNKWSAQGCFTQTAFNYWLITGNSYIWSNRVGSMSKELWVLRPDRIAIQPGKSIGEIDHYQYMINGSIQNLVYEDVLHLKLFQTFANEYFGLSPVMVGRLLIDTDNNAVNWNRALLKNRSRPDAIFTFKEPLTDEQRTAFQARLNEEHGGSTNSGKPLVVEGSDFTYQELSSSPREMDFTGSTSLTNRRICQLYNVPPELIGDPQNKTYCLPGDTRVSTPSGPKRIDEIEPGQEVWSLKEDRSDMCVSRVTRASCTGHKRILKINGSGRSLRATDNHPILIRDRSRDGATKTLKVTEFLTYRPAGELRIGDVVVVAKSYPEVNSEQRFSDNAAELFGALIGNGCVRDYGSGRAIVSMAGVAGPVRDFYRSIVGEVFGSVAEKDITVSDHEREFRFVSKKVVGFLTELGLAGNAHTKRIPDWVFSQGRSFRLSFLRGLCDTDGSVDARGVISYMSASHDLVLDIRDLCLGLGIQTGNVTMRVCKSTTPAGEKYVGEYSFVAMTQPSRNKEIGSRNPSDAERLDRESHRIVNVLSCNEGLSDPLLPPTGCGFMRVTSIEEMDSEDVYDLEVEGTHCFFAEHVCVHNSNQKEARLSLVEQVVFPLLASFRDELNNWLVPQYGDDLRIDYDKDSVDVISEKRQLVFDGLAVADWLSINEKRQVAGYDTIQDQDADIPERLLQIKTFESVQPAATPTPSESDKPVEPAIVDAPKEPNPKEPSQPIVSDNQKAWNSKYINLDTEEKKLEFWSRMDTQRRALEAGATKSFSQHFRAERGRVSAAFRSGGETAVVKVVRGRKSVLKDVYDRLYLQTGKHFFQQARTNLGVKSLEKKDLVSGLKGMIAYIRAVIPDKIAQVTDTTVDKLKKIMREGIFSGKSTDDIVSDINSLYDDQFVESRSEMLAVTETGAATNMGSAFGAKSTDRRVLKQWISQRDAAVRGPQNKSEFDHHEDTIPPVELDDLFTVSGEKLEFPNDSANGASLGNIINCFPGDTTVSAFGIENSFRRYFNGQVVDLLTARGNKLTGTANHPVLTGRGWVPIGDLIEGDYLINCTPRQPMRLGHPDIYNIPTTIEEIHNSLSLFGFNHWVVCGDMDFHGDGMKSDIEVVGPDNLLPDRGISRGLYPSDSFGFTSADDRKVLLSKDGSGRSRSHYRFRTASNTLRSEICSLSPGLSLLERRVAHPVEHGFGSIPWPYPLLDEMSLNQSSADANATCNNLYGQSFVIQVDHVAKTRRRNFSGHVFNLQTKAGLYIANGVIVHNCRCYVSFMAKKEG